CTYAALFARRSSRFLTGNRGPGSFNLSQRTKGAINRISLLFQLRDDHSYLVQVTLLCVAVTLPCTDEKFCTIILASKIINSSGVMNKSAQQSRAQSSVLLGRSDRSIRQTTSCL